MQHVAPIMFPLAQERRREGERLRAITSQLIRKSTRSLQLCVRRRVKSTLRLPSCTQSKSS